MNDNVKAFDEKMKKTCDHLGAELVTIRAGRANPHILDKLTGLCQETLFELIFLVLVVTIMSRVRIGNPVIKFLGKISLETIMLNYLLIDKLFFLYIDYGISIYLAAVLAGTIISASLIYVVKNIVLERRSGLFDGKVT